MSDFNFSLEQVINGLDLVNIKTFIKHDPKLLKYIKIPNMSLSLRNNLSLIRFIKDPKNGFNYQELKNLQNLDEIEQYFVSYTLDDRPINQYDPDKDILCDLSNDPKNQVKNLNEYSVIVGLENIIDRVKDPDLLENLLELEQFIFSDDSLFKLHDEEYFRKKVQEVIDNIDEHSIKNILKRYNQSLEQQSKNTVQINNSIEQLYYGPSRMDSSKNIKYSNGERLYNSRQRKKHLKLDFIRSLLSSNEYPYISATSNKICKKFLDPITQQMDGKSYREYDKYRNTSDAGLELDSPTGNKDTINSITNHIQNNYVESKLQEKDARLKKDEFSKKEVVAFLNEVFNSTEKDNENNKNILIEGLKELNKFYVNINSLLKKESSEFNKLDLQDKKKILFYIRPYKNVFNKTPDSSILNNINNIINENPKLCFLFNNAYDDNGGAKNLISQNIQEQLINKDISNINYIANISPKIVQDLDNNNIENEYLFNLKSDQWPSDFLQNIILMYEDPNNTNNGIYLFTNKIENTDAYKYYTELTQNAIIECLNKNTHKEEAASLIMIGEKKYPILFNHYITQNGIDIEELYDILQNYGLSHSNQKKNTQDIDQVSKIDKDLKITKDDIAEDPNKFFDLSDEEQREPENYLAALQNADQSNIMTFFSRLNELGIKLSDKEKQQIISNISTDNTNNIKQYIFNQIK